MFEIWTQDSDELGAAVRKTKRTHAQAGLRPLLLPCQRSDNFANNFVKPFYLSHPLVQAAGTQAALIHEGETGDQDPRLGLAPQKVPGPVLG